MLSALRKREVTPKVGAFSFTTFEDGTPKVQDVNSKFFSPSPHQASRVERSCDPLMRSYSLSTSSGSVQETQAANAYNTTGRELLEKGLLIEAMHRFDMSLKSLEDEGQTTKAFAVACCGKATCYENQGNLYEAIQWFLKALPIYERSSSWNPAEVAGRIGSIYERLGEPTSALKYFESAGDSLKTALLYDQLKNPEKALEYLLKVQNPENYDLVAALYDEMGNEVEANAFYAKSFHTDAPKNLENILKTRKALKGVYRDFSDADVSNVSTARARLLFEGVDKTFKRYARSIEAKAALFPSDPKTAILWKDLGNQYQYQGKKMEATRCYEKAQAITLSPARELLPLVHNAGTEMSPKRERVSKDLETLIEDLGSYKTGIGEKKKAATHLKDLLTQYREGSVSAEKVVDFVDTELAKKDNNLFKGLITQDLRKHFVKCQNLIPRKKG